MNRLELNKSINLDLFSSVKCCFAATYQLQATGLLNNQINNIERRNEKCLKI